MLTININGKMLSRSCSQMKGTSLCISPGFNQSHGRLDSAKPVNENVTLVGLHTPAARKRRFRQRKTCERKRSSGELVRTSCSEYICECRQSARTSLRESVNDSPAPVLPEDPVPRGLGGLN